MKLHQLAALRAVHETGSLLAAAGKMNLSQPAISRAIIDLEEELGVLLLERTARGAVLTPFGHTVLKRAQKISQEIDGIRNDAQLQRNALCQHLVLAITPPAATRRLAEALAQITSVWPGIALDIRELRSAQIVEGLQQGHIDMGIFPWYSPHADSRQFNTLPLYALKVALAARMAYSCPPRPNIKQLHGMPWLVLDPLPNAWSFISCFFHQYGLCAPEKIVNCISLEMYIGMAERLDAVSVWTEAGFAILEKQIQKGTMKKLAFAGEIPNATVCVCWPKTRPLSPAMKYFLKLLQERPPETSDATELAFLSHFN
ncbi:LysR family transcriptional regulator [Enterobacteriaceae bacterium YMB-R22]|jgi:LysR family transcriptional regulator of abg operon|uniref:LysR family transcriptional regulator n=1 Tax=Tenebrionicola larvae TaxID=2815733 RepID=UPI0020132ADC|nr:LysR family transcriptional regulator [Tenebrionicola larvae]MBV4412464.1 LysR family transcriptional regulator [Tenebrionicola larvae]